jgi:hypothetical protein
MFGGFKKPQPKIQKEKRNQNLASKILSGMI